MYNEIFEFLDYLYSRTRNIPKPINPPKPPIVTTITPISSPETVPTSLHTSAPIISPTSTLMAESAHISTPEPVRKLTDLQMPSFVEDIFVKKIKTFVLLHKDKIMKFGEGIIPAPIGVEIDPKTGELTVPVEIVPVGNVVLNPKIVNDLLINEGFIKIKLISYNQDSEPCPDERKCIVKEATIPIQSFHDIEGICPDDHVQEKVEIKSISVMGIPDDSVPKSGGRKINLIVKVILEVKLTICREEIISVLSCMDNSRFFKN